MKETHSRSDSRGSGFLRLAFLGLGPAVALGLALLAAGCGSADEKAPSTIKSSVVVQNYRASYDDSTGVLSSSARFTSPGPDGGGVDLASSAGITFDGGSVLKEPFFGLGYVTDEKTGFISEHSWVYVEASGKAYRNSARLVPIELGQMPAKLDPSSDTAFTFGGSPLGPAETVSLLISGYSNSGSILGYIQVEATEGANSGVIHGRDLASYSGYSGTVQLVRRHVFPLAESTVGAGQVLSEYLSQAAAIAIREKEPSL